MIAVLPTLSKKTDNIREFLCKKKAGDMVYMPSIRALVSESNAKELSRREKAQHSVKKEHKNILDMIDSLKVREVVWWASTRKREKRRERRLWTTLCGHVYEVSSCFSVAVMFMFMLLVLLCFFVFFFFFFFFFSSTLSNQPPSFPSSSYFLFPLPSSLPTSTSFRPSIPPLPQFLFLNSSSSSSV